MVTARVTLKSDGPASHTARGRTIRRGESAIVTDSSDVLYYQGLAGFNVAIIQGRKPTPDPEPEEEPEEETAPKYTRSSLNAMNKTALVELAESEEIELAEDATKAQMVDAILDAFEPKDEEPEDESEG